MTDQELKELVGSLATAQKETETQLKQTVAEVEKLSKETKELGKQLGGLGEKFGSFTEGMAFPSMEKILREMFHTNFIALRVKSRRNGKTMEIDALAYADGDVNEVYIVEVKSHLREKGLQQILDILQGFDEFFPEHRGKKRFGILAVVDVPEELQKRVLEQGVYLAKIHDELFDLRIPEGFRPRNFQRENTPKT